MIQAEIEAEQVLAHDEETEDDKGKTDQPGERPERPEGEAEQSNAGGHRRDRGIGRHAGKTGKCHSGDAEPPGAEYKSADGNHQQSGAAGQEQRHALGARRWQCQLRWYFSH